MFCSPKTSASKRNRSQHDIIRSPEVDLTAPVIPIPMECWTLSRVLQSPLTGSAFHQTRTP
uniref:Uncharacterized protein n=1 Tax=Megaselia scalaris TaxID=36166 RepID=T1GRT5_MEGSC